MASIDTAIHLQTRQAVLNISELWHEQVADLLQMRQGCDKAVKKPRPIELGAGLFIWSVVKLFATFELSTPPSSCRSIFVTIVVFDNRIKHIKWYVANI